MTSTITPERTRPILTVALPAPAKGQPKHDGPSSEARVPFSPDWINILFDRVGASWVGQYRKSSPDRTTNLNVPYDYGSVMHYSGCEHRFSRFHDLLKYYTHFQANC